MQVYDQDKDDLARDVSGGERGDVETLDQRLQLAMVERVEEIAWHVKRIADELEARPGGGRP